VFKRLFASIHATLTGTGGAPPTPASRRVEPRRAEKSVVTASSGPVGMDRSPSRERIAVHAYHRWLSRGKPIGTDWEDWFEAERQLRPAASV
jgi:hypothetical protein